MVKRYEIQEQLAEAIITYLLQGETVFASAISRLLQHVPADVRAQSVVINGRMPEAVGRSSILRGRLPIVVSDCVNTVPVLQTMHEAGNVPDAF